MGLAQLFWSNAKQWRSLAVGPIAIQFRLARSTAVSNNRHHRSKRSLIKLFGWQARKAAVSAGTWAQSAPKVLASSSLQTAIVMGVGPGLGAAIACRLVDGGMHVALAARDVYRLEPFASALQNSTSAKVRAYSCDATSDASVKDTMSLIVEELGSPDLVVYSVQGFARAAGITVETSVFEEHWRQNCLGAFVLAREAARAMLPLGRGTIVLIGSTSGMVARADHLTLAVGKFGLRALAHILARELGP